ncbi:TcpE family conjugal transfer membrane protein [Nocardiopsis deserti]|uniref:TcpE family conjugal transfer membrane protein n=1 Tax=Nocardiopsis deserti TaxID=2605988 RepID=UPI00123A8873|nr:TcpE family conjugal transfer membrane protein [Nocardiopsis deserti]
MDLPTYTNIWRIEKRLYKLYDFRLPMPLPVGTFGVALGVFALWVVLLSLVNAPFVFGNGWHLVLWVVPPGVITVLATRPVVEGKRLTELLISQARFLAEARVYNRLAPEYEPAEVRVTVRVWHRDPESGPLPLAARRRAEPEAEAVGAGAAETGDTAVRPSRSDAPPLLGVRGPADRVPAVETEEEAPARTGSGMPGQGQGQERVPAEAPRIRHRHDEETERRVPVRSQAVPARAEAAPVRSQAAPARAEAAPVLEREAPAERVPAASERAPVAVAARPGPEERSAPSHPREEEPVASAASGGDDGTPDGPRRGVGRRVLNYFGFALGSGPREAQEEEPRGSEADAGEELDDGFARERVYETEGEEQRDSDAWFARLRASSGETPVGLTAKSAYSVGDTAAMSKGELADAVDERRASDLDEEETAAARRLRGRTQGLRVAKDLEEQRRTERVRERGPRELPTSRARGQGLPGTGEEPERPRRRGRPHAAPWELEKKADPAGGYGDLSDYAARYAAATGRPAEAGALPWLPPSSSAPEEETRATADLDGDVPARTDRRDGAAGAEDTAHAAGAPGTADTDGTAGTGRPVTRAEQDAADDGSEAPAEAAPGVSTGDADAPGHTALPGAAGERPSVAPRRSATRTEGAEGRSVTGQEETVAHRSLAGLGGAAVPEDAVEHRPTTGHEDTAVPEAAPARTASGGADTGAAVDTAAQGTTTPDDTRAPDTRAAADTAAQGTAARVDTAAPDTSDTGAPVASEAERSAHKPVLEIDHGTGEQEAMPGKPREESEDRGPEWNEHMSVLDDHLITADTPAPPRPKFADAVPTQERDAKDPSRWFEDGRKRHPDQPKVGDRGNPVIPANELREERGEREENAAPTGSEDIADEAARKAEPTGQASADEPKPPTQLDHGTGELVSFVEVRDDHGRGDSNVRADSGTEQVRRRTASDLERAEAEALARRRKTARRDVSDPGDARASDGVAPPPATGSAGADRGDASFRARWSMRAAGIADSTGRDTGASGKPPSAADPRSGHADPGTAHSASGDQEHRTGAARDPRANPSMADALTQERTTSSGKERTATPTGWDTEDIGRAEDAGRAEDEAFADRPAPTVGREHPSEGPEGPEGSEGSDDPHDGVFHRVAQNARRLGQLFGQPAPGEEPEPSAREPRTALELDHGTGEQERLGDTPNGVPAYRAEEPEPRRRVEESAASDSGGTRGWRRLAKVVTGGAAPVRSDLPPSDIERLRTPLDGPRSLVVLGCTGGAGQTVTALMIGHTLAAHRDDLVVAVDVNPGPNGLSRRVGAQTPETLTGLLANAEAIQDYSRMSGYTSRTATGLEVVQTLDDPYVQTLDDRDYGQLASLLGGFYGVTLLDPAATGVARALPVADGLVLVAPANADAERAVSMTFDWLDGNGYGALRARSVLVVNGVSKRSLQDVDAAERVARGRCRAIVRIPWDDHLGSSYTRIDVGALRPATKRAHGALGGVLVNSLTQQ